MIGLLTGSWPLGMPPPGPFYRDFARQAEARGYDLLFSGDHLFMHGPNADALALLACFAGATERVTLGTGVLLPALREPVVLAKQLATIDHVSGGRLIVGAGVGGEIEQEWRAMEVPRAERGARTDEALALMQAFWSGAPLDFQGRFRTVTGVTGSPIPSRALPVWIGGRSDAALRRAARFDGWCAYAASPRRVRESVERIAEWRDLDGFRVSYVVFTCVADRAEDARATTAHVLGKRYQQDFERFLDAFCAVGTADDVAARIAAYSEAGVHDVLLVPQVPWQELPEQVDRIADALSL